MCGVSPGRQRSRETVNKPPLSSNGTRSSLQKHLHNIWSVLGSSKLTYRVTMAQFYTESRGMFVVCNGSLGPA